MAVPVTKKSKGKGKQVVSGEGNSSSWPLLMVDKGKQVQVFDDHRNPLPVPSSSSSAQFPPGFRFAPKESELIIDYLHKKAMGKTIDYHPNPVVERDLYGNEEPSQICHALGKEEHEDFYVFTLLRRSKSGGTHMSRRAGNGTWKGDHKPKDCYDDMGTLIGCRTTLTFFQNMSQRTSWIMHQYTLPDQHQGWTLCRIHNEDQAKRKRKFSAVASAPQYPIPSPPPPQPLHYDALVSIPAAKRPRTNDHTPSSSQYTQTPLQALPSDDCDSGFLSFLLDDDYVDPVQELSHTTAAQNAFNDLGPLLFPTASHHITPSNLSSTDLASSSHSQQDLPSSSQPQELDPFARDNDDWCAWLRENITLLI